MIHFPVYCKCVCVRLVLFSGRRQRNWFNFDATFACILLTFFYFIHQNLGKNLETNLPVFFQLFYFVVSREQKTRWYLYDAWTNNEFFKIEISIVIWVCLCIEYSLLFFSCVCFNMVVWLFPLNIFILFQLCWCSRTTITTATEKKSP